MVKLIAIVTLIAFAYVLIRYRTHEKLQKGIIIFLCGAFIVYLVTVVVIELMR
jgi:hypothetical protein